MGLNIYLHNPKKDYEVLEATQLTHNLTRMAKIAGIYQHLWRPEELDIEFAYQLIKPLKAAVKIVSKHPEYFKLFEAKNGWGTYEGFLKNITKYLYLCEKFPDYEIHVSR